MRNYNNVFETDEQKPMTALSADYADKYFKYQKKCLRCKETFTTKQFQQDYCDVCRTDIKMGKIFL